MASLARTGHEAERADKRLQLVVPASGGSARLEAAHRALLGDADPRVHALLKSAHRSAQIAFSGAGATDAADRLATGIYVANVVVGLLTEGELDAPDARIALDTLAEARGEPVEAAAYDLYRTACSSPLVVELPPPVACEIQLRLLVLLGVASEVSLWKVEESSIEPMVAIGHGAESRRARATARAALRRGGLTLMGSRTLRSSLVRRFSTPCAVVVARVPDTIARADAYLAVAASALAPIFERELLLERSSEREQMLVRSSEQRLMRVGFDLHDGPIQDVLALGAEITLLRDQVYPFILESHRERAAGRFDDMLARVTELDRHLRELSRSLESRSIVTLDYHHEEVGNLLIGASGELDIGECGALNRIPHAISCLALIGACELLRRCAEWPFCCAYS